MYESLAKLFTLRVAVSKGEPLIIIDAFDSHERSTYNGTHSRIDVEVRQGGKVVFPRGATWCGIPGHRTLDGIDAKEAVLSLIAMKPGDTDSDYFRRYTGEQLAFAMKYGEALSCERETRYCDENGNVRRFG